MTRRAAERPSRRGVPWWTPLLGLAALAAALVGFAARSGSHARHEAAPVRGAGAVLGTQKTLTNAAPKRPAVRRIAGLAAGSRAVEHSVRVLAVVGPEIFWIGKDKAHRTLVHLQGPGTRWGIRPGEKLTFTAVVARNRPALAARWGLTRREGRDQFARQQTHFEVYGPRIRFICVNGCS